MQDYDDIAHFVLQLARQEIAPRLIGFGHVTSYDPKRHMVRLAMPAYRMANPETGADLQTSIISPWMQLGTPWAGNGWGFQGAPSVGSAAPGSFGTQCMVLAVERDSSVSISAVMLYTSTDLAPDPSLEAGEAVLKHQSGTLMKLHASGDLDIYGSTTINLTTAGGIAVSLQDGGSVAVTLPSGQTFSINGSSDALALVSKLVSAFNAHTHSDNGEGPPNSPWSASTVESTLVKVSA